MSSRSSRVASCRTSTPDPTRSARGRGALSAGVPAGSGCGSVTGPVLFPGLGRDFAGARHDGFDDELRRARVRDLTLWLIGVANIAESVFAVNKGRRGVVGADEGRVCAARYRDVIASCKFQEAKGIASCDVNGMITEYGCEGKDIKLGGFQSKEDCHEIVNAGVGVNQDGFGHGL